MNPNTQLAQALGCDVKSQAIAVDATQATSLIDHFAVFSDPDRHLAATRRQP
ncbi:MAG: hypothetical protein NTV76_18465 [Pseudomonas sp.]|nr:hypothetical protein [Pseudomonas sp.]